MNRNGSPIQGNKQTLLVPKTKRKLTDSQTEKKKRVYHLSRNEEDEDYFSILHIRAEPIRIVFLNRNNDNSTTLSLLSLFFLRIFSHFFHYYRRLFCPFRFKQEKGKQPYQEFSINLRVIRFDLS